jgi:hypothetical protein
MAAGAYDDDIAMVLELVEEAGQVCEWHKDVVTPTDPDRPWLGGVPDPQVHHPSIAFVPPAEMRFGYGMTSFPADEQVARFSTFGLMGVQDFEPLPTDKVLRDGVPLVIAAIDVIRPAEDPVLYVLKIV